MKIIGDQKFIFKVRSGTATTLNIIDACSPWYAKMNRWTIWNQGVKCLISNQWLTVVKVTLVWDATYNLGPVYMEVGDPR